MDTFLDPRFFFRDGGERTLSVEAAAIRFGPGVLAELGAEARSLQLTRVALIVDPRARELPPFEIGRAALVAAGVEVVVYDGVEIEPSETSVLAAAAFAQDAGVDGFVSLGGGSTIDTAKIANLLSSFPAPILDYVNVPTGLGRPVPGPLKPHIACPTTFGTASETTGIAVFDLPAQGTKTGIVSRRIRPTLGVLDPGNLAFLPAGVVAANAFDVLSHAIESLTARPFTARPMPFDPLLRPLSQGANPFSDLGCREAIRRAAPALVRAVRDPEDGEARQSLMFAGLLAGIGFGNAGCHLPHAMSYPVSMPSNEHAVAFRAAGYPGDKPLVPHGIAVGVHLPAVMRSTCAAAPRRHAEALAALAGADTDEGAGLAADAGDDEVGEALAGRLAALMREVGMPNGLSGLGLSADDIDRLATGAFQQKRLTDNAPSPVGLDDLKAIYRQALSYW